MVLDTRPIPPAPRIRVRFDPDDAHPIIQLLEERERSEHGRDEHRHIELLAERRAA
jgi:hypothetical protein